MEAKIKSNPKPFMESMDKKFFFGVSLVLILSPLFVYLLIRYTQSDPLYIGGVVIAVLLGFQGIFVARAIISETNNKEKLKKD